MPHAPDDPRLTAHALGELDEFDRPEVEALLEADLEARASVEEIRAAARLLTECLRDEPGPGLAPEHHRAIETRLTLGPTPPRRPRRRWIGLAIAASLAGLALTMTHSWHQSRREPKPQLAMGHYAKEDLAPIPPAIQATNVPPWALFARSNRGFAPISPAPKAAETHFVTELSVASAPVTGAAPVVAMDAPGRIDSRSGRADRLRDSDAIQVPSQPPEPRSVPALKFEAQAQAGKSAALGTHDRASASSAGLPGAAGLSAGGYAFDKSKLAASGAASVAAGKSATTPSTAPDRPLGLVRSSQPTEATGYAVAEGLVRKSKLGQEGRKLQLDFLDASKEAEVLAKRVQFEKPPALLLAEGEQKGVGEAKDLRQLIEGRKQILNQEARAEGEGFAPISDNPFLPVAENRLSTFSIDVDTAAYANVRRFLNQNTNPPPDAVRIEELINYFPYPYPAPQAGDPFSVSCEVARSPWDAEHRLVRIGLKGREIEADKRPPSNLVFLIDVSGSMDKIDKLPLLKAGMKLLVEQLGENDHVAIVVYAAQVGLVLDSTHADHKAEILSSLEQLQAGGSTNGGQGIQLAYDLAVRNFIKGGTNRVILATDGDFNLGVTEGPELDRLIEEKRKTGVFLSVLGFGQGNVKHDKLEGLADKGNGQYCYIDSIKEARKVLVEQMGGTLVAIAKDVKIQVEFDPEKTSAYRLIGYENRLLQARDFEDDRKDAGEIGAGHCVTALYEVVPTGQEGAVVQNAGGNANYQQASKLRQQAAKGNARLLNVHLRFKAPDDDVSRLITVPADDDGRDFSAATADFRFASSVAGFGMLLRNSPYKGSLSWDGLVELASGAVGPDLGGYRTEFLGLVRKAREIAGR